MAKPSPDGGRDVYTPVEPFSAPYNGQDWSLVPNSTFVREGHPLLELYPHLFRPVRCQFDVEAASASPGEKRDR